MNNNNNEKDTLAPSSKSKHPINISSKPTIYAKNCTFFQKKDIIHRSQNIKIKSGVYLITIETPNYRFLVKSYTLRKWQEERHRIAAVCSFTVGRIKYGNRKKLPVSDANVSYITFAHYVVFVYLIVCYLYLYPNNSRYSITTST